MDKFKGYYVEEPMQTVYYFFNENLISVENFIKLERMALDNAADKGHRLFKTFDTQIDYIFLGKN